LIDNQLTAGRSLRFEVIVTTILTVSILFGALYITTRKAFQAMVRDRIRTDMSLLFSSLDWAFSSLIDSGNFESMRRLAENVGSYRSLERVVLLDREGVVVVSDSPELIGQGTDFVGSPEIFSSYFQSDAIAMQSWFEDDEELFAYPVRSKQYRTADTTDVYGVLVLDPDLAYYRRVFDALANQVVVSILLAGAFLLVLLLLLISRIVLKPIEVFTQATRKIAAGDYNISISMRRNDEFGEFARAFEQMAARIKLANSRLDEYSKDLEIEVQHRTAQLKRSLEELRQAQGYLVQSEKMASIGQLAAGVAHEINNPTGFMMSNLGTLEEYVTAYRVLVSKHRELSGHVFSQESGKIGALLEEIRSFERLEGFPEIESDIISLIRETREGAVRIRDIVDSLRDFARPDQDGFDLCDVREVVDRALRITSNRLKYHCDVIKRLEHVPNIFCSANKIEQVVVNLLSNAADAVRDRGTVTVGTYLEANSVMISVRDDGVGIAEENLSRVFDPFYTSKDVGQGTGLGLYISHQIIQDHGGSIRVVSEPGKGTEFLLALPVRGEGERGDDSR
jgi:two-component system, NtrC family, sensor kinase